MLIDMLKYYTQCPTIHSNTSHNVLAQVLLLTSSVLYLCLLCSMLLYRNLQDESAPIVVGLESVQDRG